MKRKRLLNFDFKSYPNIIVFTVEGAIFTLVSVLSNNTINLFLTRANASDYEISLYTMLTQIVGISTLIPISIWADRLKNKRKLVCGILCFISICFLAVSVSPFFQERAVALLIITAAFGIGGITLFTSIWQAFFADVIPEDQINLAYASRNRVTFLVQLIGCLLVGILLSSIPSDAGKIRMHQTFFFLAAFFAVLEIFSLCKIRGGDVKEQTANTVQDLFLTVKDLFKNKRFLIFMAVILLFYLTWKLDGTVFYLSQVKYIGLSEFWLSVSMAVNAVGQILSVGFWAKINEKKGCRFGIIFGALGLVVSPVCVIVPLQFEGLVRIITHLVLRFITDLGFTTVLLNCLQNLLQVISEKNRSFSIAVYTTIISLASSFMPVVGVMIYTAWGADQQAMIHTFQMIGFVRVLSLIALTLRWYFMRHSPK